MKNQQQTQQHLAAIDLGSNSFHMVVARIEDGHIHILDNLKEMVRLGALFCLERFGERVNNLDLPGLRSDRQPVFCRRSCHPHCHL